MLNFMNLQTTRKGALYTCECAKCGSTLYVHEWADWNNNDRRDAMLAGTLRCDLCPGLADPETFHDEGQQYACRYSAPGYMDCTDWSFGPNRRTLERETRRLYA